MIIWGSGGGGADLGQVELRHCETCGKERPFKLLLQYKYAHLYYLRWVTEKKYHMACDVCRRGWELNAADVEPKLKENPIPFMTRFGWTFLLAGVIVLIVVAVASSGPATGDGMGTGKARGVWSGEDRGTSDGGVFRVGGDVSAPSIVYRVEPTYSAEARKASYQGVVILSAIVRKDGTIEILKVVRGLGLGLDENAIQALKQWKFRPGMKNGDPVDVALNIEVDFSLR